jgi:Flp pilus assembly protein TadD
VRRSHPWALSGWGWFVGMLVPVIGLVQVGEQARADRYTYVPVVGLFVIAVWGTAELAARLGARRFVPVLALLVLGAATVRTRSQLATWRDAASLFGHAVEVTGPNPVARVNLAMALAGKGEPAAARAHLEEALRLRPGYAVAHLDLGLLLTGQGQLSEAETHLRQALRLDPGYAEAHNNLGIVLALEGNEDEAARHFGRALALDPSYPEPHANLGRIRAQQRRFDEARQLLERAVTLKPGYAEAHFNLGMVHLLEGRKAEARAAVERARRFGYPAPPEVLERLAP